MSFLDKDNFKVLFKACLKMCLVIFHRLLDRIDGRWII